MTVKVTAALTIATLALCVGRGSLTAHAQIRVQPGKMPKIADVDPRFLSFNVEAVEVTGGNFWKPYKDSGTAAKPEGSGEANKPAGMAASLFQYRPPINLANPELRKLAGALSPAYLRVSGTWRNSTFFQDDDKPVLSNPPSGFKGVMTRAEWKGVVNFAKAIRAKIVTSVAVSAGTRDANGVWTPGQAKAFFEYTKSIGGQIAAAEFMNEPSFAMVGGAPKGYDAAAFARDVRIFHDFLRAESPGTLLLGPGSVGEGVSLTMGSPMPGFINTPAMMKATGPIYDVFSYHFYPTVSERCSGPKHATTPNQALTTEWLERNLITEAFYAKQRDEFMPGKPLWLTETGEAGCGGDPFAAEFLDSFRFMDQLGSLAQKGVQTVMVNTLASSDYGLLDEETLEPRPNYWAALLWKRLMGSHVLDSGVAPDPKTRVYAHCSAHGAGSVTVLVLNLDKTTEQNFEVSSVGKRYTLSSENLLSRSVTLNGSELRLGPDGKLPSIKGERFRAGTLHLPPTSITFLVFPGTKNGMCK